MVGNQHAAKTAEKHTLYPTIVNQLVTFCRLNVKKLSKKKKMRIINVFVAMLLASSTVPIFAENDAMIISKLDSSTPSVFDIDAVKEIAFNADGFQVIDQQSVATDFAWANLNEITFSLVSGVEQVKAEPVEIGADAQYFDLTGRMLSGDNLPAGIYIVKNGSRTYKIKKQ